MKAVCNSKNTEAVKYSVEDQASLVDERYLCIDVPLKNSYSDIHE